MYICSMYRLHFCSPFFERKKRELLWEVCFGSYYLGFEKSIMKILFWKVSSQYISHVLEILFYFRKFILKDIIYILENLFQKLYSESLLLSVLKGLLQFWKIQKIYSWKIFGIYDREVTFKKKSKMSFEKLWSGVRNYDIQKENVLSHIVLCPFRKLINLVMISFEILMVI